MTSSWVQFPLVYHLDVRVWLAQLSRELGRTITLSEVPDAEIDKWSASHFDAIWLMGVWQTGDQSRTLALNNPSHPDEWADILPDWKPDDAVASPYSITAYRVAETLGGPAALAELRKRLARRGIKLILDFVANHTAPEHPWTSTNRDFYIVVPDRQLEQMEKGACFKADDGAHLACGRDPNFPPWRDTVQLNFANPEVHSALIRLLQGIAAQCDGVRCDTAMLMLKDVFNRIWGALAGEMRAEFWDVAIAEVRKVAPGFLFVAEAYWGTDWHLQQLGFDFTYDNEFYERLLRRDIAGVKAHLTAEWEFARKLLRFTENHDGARATAALGDNNKAASLLTLTVAGAHLMHEGQSEGLHRKWSLYLVRRSKEEPDLDVEAFYERLIEVIGNPAITRGDFRLLELKGGRSGTVIAFQRCCGEEGRIICAVNLSDSGDEISFETDAFAHVKDYREMRIVSTERGCTPQVDLWSGGVTLRLRAHEGLLFVAR